MPWEIFVYNKTRQIIVISTGLIPTIKDGLTFPVNLKKYRKPIKIPKDVELLTKDILQNQNNLDSIFRIVKFFKNEIKKRPKTVFTLFLIKSLRGWFATNSHRFENLVLSI